MATIGSIVTIQLLLRENVLRATPVSSLQLLMFAAVNHALPMLASLSEFKPLINTLKDPVRTFTTVGLVQIALLLTHAIYRTTLQAPRKTITNAILVPLGVFRQPYVIQIWGMGLIGSFAMLVVYLLGFGQSEGGGGVNPIFKVLQALIGFTAAPYLIPILGALSARPVKVFKKDYQLLGLYFCMNLALALGRNSRSAFLIGFASVLFVAMVGILLGQIKIKRIRWGWIVAAAIIAIPVTAAVSDLSIAMQMARANRGKVSTIDLMGESITLFFDKDAINNYRKLIGLRDAAQTGVGADERPAMYSMNEETLNRGEWAENYTSNPVLNRFIYVKIHDNLLSLSKTYSQSDQAYLRDYTTRWIASIFPTPVLRVVGLGNLKQNTQIGSMGDMMYYLATRVPFFSYRSGSWIAHGLAAYGNLFWPIVMLLAILVFTLSDSLVRKVTPAEIGHFGRSPTHLVFAFVALVNLFYSAQMFSADSIGDFTGFIIRNFLQSILLYLAMFHATRWLGGKFGRR